MDDNFDYEAQYSIQQPVSIISKMLTLGDFIPKIINSLSNNKDTDTSVSTHPQFHELYEVKIKS